MTYEHSSVYVVRVVDADETWTVGPYGSTRAVQVADRLLAVATGTRECHVEPLFSDDECLYVGDYSRQGHPAST
jgi:hypothetical protein